jgi:hypothetical protein
VDVTEKDQGTDRAGRRLVSRSSIFGLDSREPLDEIESIMPSSSARVYTSGRQFVDQWFPACELQPQHSGIGQDVQKSLAVGPGQSLELLQSQVADLAVVVAAQVAGLASHELENLGPSLSGLPGRQTLLCMNKHQYHDFSYKEPSALLFVTHKSM